MGWEVEFFFKKKLYYKSGGGGVLGVVGYGGKRWKNILIFVSVIFFCNDTYLAFN